MRRVPAISVMIELQTHPYTQAVLAAWTRIDGGADAADIGPMTDDLPGLVGGLFVLNRVTGGDYSFRRAGAGLEKLFGRSLAEHNFLSLWSETDRPLICAALDAARHGRGPAIVRARGETLHGRMIDLEFALAPLLQARDSGRFLGMCQCVSPEETLAGRPLRRLQTLAVFPPVAEREPMIRLVARSD